MNPNTDRHGHPPLKDTELVENLEVILSTMRHQLGNSVNAIKITLDVLKQNFDQFNDGKKMDYLDRGAQLLARQQGLIEAMKSYGQFDVREQSDIDVIPFWKHVTEQAEMRIQGTGIALRTDSRLKPTVIRGSSVALDKSIACVIDNAVEAVGDSASPSIELEAAAEADGLVIAIRDNGHGIPPGDLDRVRIPLFSTKPGRAGMGLSIAHKLLSKMNGRLAIDSAPGKGTSVAITLAGA